MGDTVANARAEWELVLQKDHASNEAWAAQSLWASAYAEPLMAENERLREALTIAVDALRVHAGRSVEAGDPEFCPWHAVDRLERVGEALGGLDRD